MATLSTLRIKFLIVLLSVPLLYSCNNTQQWDFLGLEALEYNNIPMVADSVIELEFHKKQRNIVGNVRDALIRAGFTQAETLDQTMLYSSSFDERLLRENVAKGLTFSQIDAKTSYFKGFTGININLIESEESIILKLTKYKLNPHKTTAQDMAIKFRTNMLAGKYVLSSRVIQKTDSMDVEIREKFKVLYDESKLRLYIHEHGTYDEKFSFFGEKQITGKWEIDNEKNQIVLNPNVLNETDLIDSYFIKQADSLDTSTRMEIIYLRRSGFTVKTYHDMGIEVVSVFTREVMDETESSTDPTV